MADLRIGTAGWSVPLANAASFPEEGASLERYSTRFRCAEINSTFHRPHRTSTFERWAASVPDGFLFSAKIPKTITHQQRLQESEPLLDAFLGEVAALGEKLSILLVQLPPSFAYDKLIVGRFLDQLQQRSALQIACEPRHASWFEESAEHFLSDRQVARVAADPAKVPAAAEPGAWRGLSYYRLHGSPVPYRSSYDAERLANYANAIARDLDAGRPTWCIFDNTASSAAVGNALDLQSLLGEG